MQNEQPLDLPYDTIAGLFVETVRKNEGISFSRRTGEEEWTGISYDELLERVESLALGFEALGFAKGDRLGLVSENRLEWIETDFAAVCSGIVDVPTFPILTAEQLAYIFNDARTKGVVCSNAFQLRKLVAVANQIPTLDTIVVFEPGAIDSVAPSRSIGRTDGSSITIYSLDEVRSRGKDVRAGGRRRLDDLVERVKPDDLLTLIYTSGTTGHPKGVMLSHRNMVENIKGSAAVFPVRSDDIVLSYLPLCHAFERMAGYYTCFAMGATINFARSIETLVVDLGEVRPTLMTTVPRFLERFRGRVEANVRKGPEKKQKVFDWAVDVGARWFEKMQKKGSVGPILGMKHSLADRLVFAKIRERTGNRLRYFISGGAPLHRDVASFFFGAGLPIIEGYGLTEASPVLTVNPADRPKVGTVGRAIPNVELKIAADGEIVARGPNMMVGYHNDEAATTEMIDDEGWLHTGDIGKIDADGYVAITDRKKHLFVSSGGKNIAPGPIEEELATIPLVGQVMLIGDDLPYLTALIVPDVEAGKEALASVGSRVDGSDEEVRAALAESEQIATMIDTAIKEVQRDESAFERVRRFVLLPEEATVDNGLLTPTLKLKRREVMRRYHDEIAGMYPDETIHVPE